MAQNPQRQHAGPSLGCKGSDTENGGQGFLQITLAHHQNSVRPNLIFSVVKDFPGMVDKGVAAEVWDRWQHVLSPHLHLSLGCEAPTPATVLPFLVQNLGFRLSSCY